MNKATPIPDTIERRASGTTEIASCQHDGTRITRSIHNYELAWWHVATSRIYCAEKP